MKKYMFWVYEFEDGTILKLVNVGLSAREVWKLEDVHGKLVKSGREKPE